jgi:hypothetical protein
MSRQNLVIWLSVSCSMITATSCDNLHYGHKITRYGNVRFFGTGSIEVMTISSSPPSRNIELSLPDGQRLQVSSITREELKRLFGGPKKTVNTSDRGVREHFGTDHCTITIESGEFESLDVGMGFSIHNLDNGKSFKLPVVESELRAVFGKPTAIEYANSQQP